MTNGEGSGRDLFQLDELQQLEQRLPQFRFIPALSEPLPEDAWKGEQGLITEVVQRHRARLADTEAYMCGPTAMIDAAIALLTTRGMNESDMLYDKFVTKADTGG